MKDAQNAGYLNGTPTDIDNIFAEVFADDPDDPPDFSSLSYNASINGSLDFYNKLYSVDIDEYNQHNVFIINWFYKF